MNDLSSSVVNAVSITDVLSGAVSMPYLNATAWKSVQHDCQVLRRAYAHLTQGTRPTKKIKNVKDDRNTASGTKMAGISVDKLRENVRVTG